MPAFLPYLFSALISADPPLAPIYPQTAGPDPLRVQQWAFDDMNVPETFPAPGVPVTVAVIDSGVDYNHPDLQRALWRNPGESGTDAAGADRATNGIDDDANGFVDDVIGWDFVDYDRLPYDAPEGANEGHGTQVSGILAATVGNGIGVAGIAPVARVMTLRFLDNKGFGATAAAVDAIRYAIRNGARILNISWGGAREKVQDEANLRAAFAEADQAGLLVVASAGNKNTDLDRQPERNVPGTYGCANMILVTSSGPGGNRAIFANVGARRVDLAAPGVDILAPTPGGKYDWTDGSSMSVPFVTGAAAWLWSLHPEWSAREVKAAILRSVIPTEAFVGQTRTGGRLDFSAVLREATGRGTRVP